MAVRIVAVLAIAWANALTAYADNYDIVVYGGTAGGVAAAVEAARLGKTVAIIEPSQHLGGMTTGGLSATDYGNKLAIRGLAREFYTRVGQSYGQGTTYYFEPKVAESVINSWVASLPNITVIKGERLNLNGGVSKTGNTINSIQMESGRTFSAGVFIDSSYEGDLMAKSGVNYIVGRESNATYGESHNGVFVNTQSLNVDPYVVPGNPASGVLPMLSNQLPPPNGTADNNVQAYNFRLTVTTNAANKLPWTAPPNYNRVAVRAPEAGHSGHESNFDHAALAAGAAEHAWRREQVRRERQRQPDDGLHRLRRLQQELPRCRLRHAAANHHRSSKLRTGVPILSGDRSKRATGRARRHE